MKHMVCFFSAGVVWANLTFRGRNFCQNLIQKVLKYTRPIYSTRSLQIRGVFDVIQKVMWYICSHEDQTVTRDPTLQNFQFWLFRHGAPKAALCRNIRNWEFWTILSDMRDCLPLVRANVSLSHRKHPGFEEISTSRWAQYIFFLSNSQNSSS